MSLAEDSFNGIEIVNRHGRYFVLVRKGGDVAEYGPFSRQAAHALAGEEEARTVAKAAEPAAVGPDPLNDLRQFLKERTDTAFGWI